MSIASLTLSKINFSLPVERIGFQINQLLLSEMETGIKELDHLSAMGTQYVQITSQLNPTRVKSLLQLHQENVNEAEQLLNTKIAELSDLFANLGRHLPYAGVPENNPFKNPLFTKLSPIDCSLPVQKIRIIITRFLTQTLQAAKPQEQLISFTENFAQQTQDEKDFIDKMAKISSLAQIISRLPDEQLIQHLSHEPFKVETFFEKLQSTVTIPIHPKFLVHLRSFFGNMPKNIQDSEKEAIFYQFGKGSPEKAISVLNQIYECKCFHGFITRNQASEKLLEALNKNNGLRGQFLFRFSESGLREGKFALDAYRLDEIGNYSVLVQFDKSLNGFIIGSDKLHVYETIEAIVNDPLHQALIPHPVSNGSVSAVKTDTEKYFDILLSISNKQFNSYEKIFLWQCIDSLFASYQGTFEEKRFAFQEQFGWTNLGDELMSVYAVFNLKK